MRGESNHLLARVGQSFRCRKILIGEEHLVAWNREQVDGRHAHDVGDNHYWVQIAVDDVLLLRAADEIKREAHPLEGVRILTFHRQETLPATGDLPAEDAQDTGTRCKV